MHYPFRSLLWLYLDICFSTFDVGALERAELEELARRNRDLAKLMLTIGCLLLLPLLGVGLAASLGGVSFFGLPADLCVAAALVGWMVAQLLLLGLLILFCTFCLEWEPLGFVLALAELLHTTPEVLQNIWRAMVLLPLMGVLLLYW